MAIVIDLVWILNAHPGTQEYQYGLLVTILATMIFFGKKSLVTKGLEFGGPSRFCL
jgi:hypothetical protein